MKTNLTQNPATCLLHCQLGFALLLLLFAFNAQAALAPFGTEFTYQGRLNDASGGASGRYDFRFALQDAASGGTPIVTVTNVNVAVSNGLFTTPINFGANIFIGYALWLDIGVRSNGTATTFTPLSPRQPITPTPNAHYASLAATVPGGSINSSKLAVDSVTTSALQNNAVTGAKIANGQVVRNLNGLQDTVILAAGTNATLTTNGNTLTLAASSDWRLDGNAGTSAGPNFLGTTDNQPLELRVNGARALRLEPHGPAAASLAGGYLQNSVAGFHGAAIAGGGTSGSPNVALGNYAFVGAGHGGQASDYSAVVAGAYNVSPGQFSFIGSGERNTNQANYSVIAGGTNSFIAPAALNSFIGGGALHRVTVEFGTVAGGINNSVTAGGGFVGGGNSNTASNLNGTVSGGIGNVVGGNAGTIGGGINNRVNDDFATVAGGFNNIASGTGAVIAGGGTDGTDFSGNSAAGPGSVIGGGAGNTSSGKSSTVPGGFLNTAAGEYSFAAGAHAKANHQGSFVWADSQIADFASATENQFSLRASGGVRLSDDTPSLSFGAVTRQMLDLFGKSYGIGVQPLTTYFRTTGAFAWFDRGSHVDAQRNAGPGGNVLMSLDSTGLGIGTTSPTRRLEVQSAGDVEIGLKSTDLNGRLWTIQSSGNGTPGRERTFQIIDRTAGESRLLINDAGLVGIGTATPSAQLHAVASGGNGVQGNSSNPGASGVYGENTGQGYGVAGRTTGFGTAVLGDNADPNGWAGDFNGRVRVGVLTITGGADLAEPFKMSGKELPKGAVVVIDGANPGHLRLSESAYDTRVAGIISGANGVNPGISLSQQGVMEGDQNVALSGRVYVQADASNGSIKPGDLLTTSVTPGHAMKVDDHAKAQGAILGKAMTALAEGKGMVLVLVTLQ